ncbi:hypothetical protein, partial [Burkholderia ubonensis]|uniref:hypothetical protein n=1 Tax=Burkholderia ubonensis TaxID=101571 RepID=UPI001E2F8962
MQLRFTSFAVISLWRDFHPQECAHAGRTQKKAPRLRGFFVAATGTAANRRTRSGTAARRVGRRQALA